MNQMGLQMTVGGWGRSQDCSRRCVESPPRPRKKRAPVSSAQSRTLVPVSIALCVLCAVGAWVLLLRLCGAPAGCSLARSLVLQRRETDRERWLRALAFSLPTSTSSARGVVQFWLTRRPTPAAIYGHRHPGGVSGLALSSLVSSLTHHLSSAALRFPIPSFSVCEHNNGVPVRPSRPIPYPKIPVLDSLHDLNDIFH